MLQKINKIFDVVQFFFLEDGEVIFLKKSGNLSLDCELSDIKSIRKFQNKIIVQNNEGTLFFLDKSGKILSKAIGNFHLIKSYSLEDRFYVLGEFEGRDHFFSFESNGSYNPVGWTNNFVRKIVEKGFFALNRQELSFNELDSGNARWKIGLSELLKNSGNVSLQSDLIICEEKLFFYLSDYNQCTGFFCFNLLSGELLLETQKVGMWFQSYEGKVFGISALNNGIDIMNPDTFEIESVNLSAICILDSILMDKKIFCVLENTFYFSQNLGSDIALVGAVSLQSEQIIWTHKFEKNNGRIVDLKANSNNLYVLTEDKTLHKFTS